MRDAIVLEQVSKIYDGKTVLDNVSMTFGAGGRYCITGPSGCGKTTLLNVLMGLTAPDSGAVVGADCHRMAPVFQENRLCENLSVGANIRLTSRNKLSPGQISDTLDRLLLPGAIHKTVRALSGGMKRRVAIARALLSGGDLLIFDEAFRELDEATAEAVAGEVMRALDGKTLIMVTHDLSLVGRLSCEHIPFS